MMPTICPVERRLAGSGGRDFGGGVAVEYRVVLKLLLVRVIIVGTVAEEVVSVDPVGDDDGEVGS
jgi:hypothetical protein